ncbi:protein-L-isoaspartate(D-aspartate) O-methyltransferase [Nonomuraea endophytica]|uniref:Protein-L-isoaspartate O-methyltransferase n=1 Tax=Nonomuraea endophytica TaxID=714136 RepID=A0A7W7ZY59_9ACTN|nr:protein-L-isoaspartate(D-aspartate) O-methyltransferase [Nonomuraea endophytica]
MIAYLVSEHVLTPGASGVERLIQALRAVPRHLFVPPRAWASPQGWRGEERVIDATADYGDWWDAAYTNTAIVTQRDDGAAEPTDNERLPTSSLSCPYIAMTWLRELEVDRRHCVLDIGTGTGWTAAVLAHLTDDNVVSIDIDPAITQQAEKNLALTGLSPTIITGDGAAGHAVGAPYDRVHVACGVSDIPYPWIEQTRPGGVIVLPYMPHPHAWGALLQLRVRDDGSAIGTFRDSGGYMMMRSQRPGRWPAYSGDSFESTTQVDPREIWSALDAGFGLSLASAAPHIIITGSGWEQSDDWSGWVMRLRDLRGDGWAVASARPGEDTDVVQTCARQLWTQLETAFMEWLCAGRPDRSAYRMLVTPSGQEVRLT